MNNQAMPASADLPAMYLWAQGIMAREPDFVIGDDYLRRWYVLPRNPWLNLYLHQIRKSDDDRAMHDHPWANTSFLIDGCYTEHTPDGVFERNEGDVVSREAGALHRIELPPGSWAISLFATGPKVREWGFACAQGWVHWADFTDPANMGAVGRGCGEHDAPTRIAPIGRLPT